MSPNLRLSHGLGTLFLALVASLSCHSALAQWQWVDDTGRKVFSDTPPPAGIPDKNILKRPGAVVGPAQTAPEATPAPVAPKLSTNDRELEAKKKLSEEAEAAKQKAEAEKVAKARAENCERAKRAKATMDSGIRIATLNAKGEREFMDDAARAAENKRLDEVVRSDCGSVPPQPLQ